MLLAPSTFTAIRLISSQLKLQVLCALSSLETRLIASGAWWQLQDRLSVLLMRLPLPQLESLRLPKRPSAARKKRSTHARKKTLHLLLTWSLFSVELRYLHLSAICLCCTEALPARLSTSLQRRWWCLQNLARCLMTVSAPLMKSLHLQQQQK